MKTKNDTLSLLSAFFCLEAEFLVHYSSRGFDSRPLVIKIAQYLKTFSMSFISLLDLLPLFESHYVRLLPQFQFVTVIRLFSKRQLKVPKRLITMSNTMNTAYSIAFFCRNSKLLYTHLASSWILF